MTIIPRSLTLPITAIHFQNHSSFILGDTFFMTLLILVKTRVFVFKFVFDLFQTKFSSTLKKYDQSYEFLSEAF